MEIKQTKEELRDSMMVNANTAIIDVRLAAAHLWSVSPKEFGPDVTAESEVRFRPTAYRNPEGFLVFGINFRFAVSTSQEGEKPKPLIKIACLFEAEYSLNPKFTPTEDQLRAFHRGNAVFNCWPYFREFVQNSTVRMHMPPPPVPFLRLMPPKSESKRAELLPPPKALRGTSE